MTPLEKKQLFLQLRHISLLKTYLKGEIEDAQKVLEQAADLNMILRAQGLIRLARNMLDEIAAIESAAKSTQ